MFFYSTLPLSRILLLGVVSWGLLWLMGCPLDTTPLDPLRCVEQSDCGPGRICSENFCILRDGTSGTLCSPGVNFCQGDTLRACNAQGQPESMALANCMLEGNICFGGQCVPQCEPATGYCEGNTAITCGADGRTVQERRCAGTPPSCMQGSCTGSCIPETSFCVDNSVAVCANDGISLQVSPCPMGTACQDGTCANNTECPNPVINARLSDGPLAPGHLVATVGDTLVLDASQSNDPGGDVIVRYLWTVNPPAGSTTMLSPTTESIAPTLPIDSPGLYNILLEVFDDEGLVNCPPAVYTVYATPTPNALVIFLSWSKDIDLDIDLDLKLLRTPGEWYDEQDTCGLNIDCQGLQATFSGDESGGMVPEVISLDMPTTATYKIGLTTFFLEPNTPFHPNLKIWYQKNPIYDQDFALVATPTDFYEIASLTSNPPNLPVGAMSNVNAEICSFDEETQQASCGEEMLPCSAEGLCP